MTLPAGGRHPFTLRELAERTGHSLDWFYRPGNLDALYADKMPRPIASRGHKRWERSGMEAWLRRHHPLAAANDDLPVPEPMNDRAWRSRLALEYGKG